MSGGTGWTSLGGQLSGGTPAVAQNFDGRLELFAPSAGPQHQNWSISGRPAPTAAGAVGPASGHHQANSLAASLSSAMLTAGSKRSSAWGAATERVGQLGTSGRIGAPADAHVAGSVVGGRVDDAVRHAVVVAGAADVGMGTDGSEGNADGLADGLVFIADVAVKADVEDCVGAEIMGGHGERPTRVGCARLCITQVR